MRSRTATWFECKIAFEKVMENGLQKKVTEKYVVNALSHSEAEERIKEEMSAYISGECTRRYSSCRWARRWWPDRRKTCCMP